MKTAFDKYIIVHGCPKDEASSLPKSKKWMNWLEGKLKEKGLDAVAPDMPTPWAPQYEEWKKVLEKYQVTENTMLIGHSCGGAFLVRWLLETKTKVKKLILVAPAKIPEIAGDARGELYKFNLPEDGSSIADEIVIFISNDFPHNMKSFELYKRSLRPRVVQLENKVHFLIFWMGTNEFPELLDEVLK